MKNINELIGFVKGINLDDVINEKEIDHLQSWVDRNRNLAYEANEIELINLIDMIIEDHIITEDERIKLVDYCNAYFSESSIDNEIYVLQGLLEGIISDGVVNDQEIEGLRSWLKKYSKCFDEIEVYREIISTINEILEDGIVTEQEKDVLLNLLENQITEIEFISKITYLRNKIKNRELIGVDLIDLLGNEESLDKIHSMAIKELRKTLRSNCGLIVEDKEIVLISLSIIAMLNYEEGRFYDSVQETYDSLYDSFSPQKIEGLIRSVLSRYRIDRNINERQVNVALRNAIVPGFYLSSFFDFVYDIYKLNFQFNLPRDIYEEFQFVYEGLRQTMLSEGDDVQVNVTKKTYKLIKTTKQLIASENYVDSVIKLSIIVVRLIDKKIWNKEIKVYNPYLKKGFSSWADKNSISSRDLEGHKETTFRSRWEPKFMLLDNNVYIVPPVHRIKSFYDYTKVRIEVENNGEVLYSNSRPDIREIMGGYELNLDKIPISNPLGNLTYRLYAGDKIIYDSKDTLYRNVIAFSYKDNSEIKNNTDFSGNVIFCYYGENNTLKKYHETTKFMLAVYGAHLGDGILIGTEIFNFSSLTRPGVFGEEIIDHFLYDSTKNQKYKVFKKVECLVFETNHIDAEIDINIDGKVCRVKDLEFEIYNRLGVIKYVIQIPELESGFHDIIIYESIQGRKNEIASFGFAIDTALQVEIRDNGDNTYIVSVGSNIINDVITHTISADTFDPEWLKIKFLGRRLSYQVPMPFTFYSLDGISWKSAKEPLWIGDISPETTIRVSNKKIIELCVYGSSGSQIEEAISLSDKPLFRETRIGFLKTYAESNSYFLLLMMGQNAREDIFICYNKCQISDNTKIEYDSNDKRLDIETRFWGKGNVYFTLTDDKGNVLYKSDTVEDGELISIEGLKSFIPYHINYYEKKKGLSLKGDRKLETFDKVIYDLHNLVGNTFKISEVYYDQMARGVLLRKNHYFNKTFVRITKQLEDGKYGGDLYTNTSKGIFWLYNLNPVEIEICGDAVDGTVEVSITKDNDGLFLDFDHHAIMNTLDDPKAIDIFSYIMDLKGIEFV